MCTVVSQWSIDPHNNLIVGYGLLPELCSDSAGGCYITYEQNFAYPRRLVLERLDRYGYKPWGSGKRITGLLLEQSSAKIVEDGVNGVIVSYQDVEITGTPDSPVITNRLRVQRVDSSGNFLWGPNGVRVSLSETDQYDQAIVSDGRGGCIVAWVDTLSQLRVQRIHSPGTRLWGDSGIHISRNIQNPILNVIDGNGGAYISWITPISYIWKMQRVHTNGEIAWDSSGINIPIGATQLIPGHNGNAVFSGFGGTINNIQYIAQKIDSSGTFCWQAPYVVLGESTQSSFKGYPIGVNSLGNFIFAWRQKISSVWDLRMQVVRNNGNFIFQQGGTSVSKYSSQKGIVGIVCSDPSTSLFIWNDWRPQSGIYAQKMDTIGNRLWETSDIPVCIPNLSAKVTTDTKGGFIVAGERDDFSIVAQQCSRNGNLGEVITAIDKEENGAIPQSFNLYQNYPNPFNPSTTILYSLPNNEWISIKLYDMLGKEVMSLFEGKQIAGKYSLMLNAIDISTGVYMLMLRTERSPPKTIKLILLR
jgi:hypothetical protein